MATKVKGEAIKEGSIPYSALSSEIKSKLGNDKYKKLDWYYNDDAGALAAKSPTNKIIINEKEYDLTDEIVGIPVNGKEYGFQYHDYRGYHVVANGSDDSDVDALTNNVFILNESSSTATPDWNAREGEAGYIENKPFRIIQSNNGEIIGINSYFTMREDAYYPNSDLFIKYDNKIALLVKEKQELYYGDNASAEIGNVDFYIADIDSELIINNSHNEEFVLLIALNSEFIPDTVLKTTPQTLSDGDINQALANLGLDIVKLKYIVDPWIIDDTLFNEDGFNGEIVAQDLCELIKMSSSYAINRFIYYNDGDAFEYACTNVETNSNNITLHFGNHYSVNLNINTGQIKAVK